MTDVQLGNGPELSIRDKKLVSAQQRFMNRGIAGIAIVVVALYVIVLVIAMRMAVGEDDMDSSKFLTLLAPWAVGPFGTVMGYFFGRLESVTSGS